MKGWLCLFFTCFSCLVEAQIITTFVGNGSLGNSGDGGPAAVAIIGAPDGSVFDAYGNFYFADAQESVIRKVNTAGIISTIAGTGTSGYNGDNIPATNAELNNPIGITLDLFDNIYIGDNANNRIRKVNSVTGIITTIAGTAASPRLISELSSGTFEK